jgi:P63C domain
VELRPDMKLPQYFGKLTNNLVYRRLAPGLLRRLKERREELEAKATSFTVGWVRI